MTGNREYGIKFGQENEEFCWGNVHFEAHTQHLVVIRIWYRSSGAMWGGDRSRWAREQTDYPWQM